MPAFLRTELQFAFDTCCFSTHKIHMICRSVVSAPRNPCQQVCHHEDQHRLNHVRFHHYGNQRMWKFFIKKCLGSFDVVESCVQCDMICIVTSSARDHGLPSRGVPHREDHQGNRSLERTLWRRWWRSPSPPPWSPRSPRWWWSPRLMYRHHWSAEDTTRIQQSHQEIYAIWLQLRLCGQVFYTVE